jgi:sugar phosphate isomerase/epimerase
LTRRDFSRLGAVPFFGSLGFDAAESFDYPWNLGIITDQVDMDLAQVLSRFYPQYQLRWAEIRYLKLAGEERYVYADATAGQLKQVKQQLDDAGVKLSVLDAAIYKIRLPGSTPATDAPAYVNGAHEKFDRQMDDLKRAANAAHVLGTDRIRIFTFRRVADPAMLFDRIVEELQQAITIASREEVRLLVENEYDCNIATGEEIAKLFRALPDTRLMHNWDPCNSYEMGEQPFPKVWNQLDHDRISHIHLKDAAGKEWKPIGAGDINFVGQFEALKSIKYSGTLSVETRYRDSSQNSYNSSVESMNGLVGVLKKI